MDDARDPAVDAERWAMLLPHRELAVGVVLRNTGNPAEAEDCVHDAMLRLVRRDDLDPARVRALLVRAALHIAVDRRRAASRQQNAVIRLGGGAGAEVTSPEQVAAQHEETARVLGALDQLPRREREVMLFRLAGLGVAETAGRLGISQKSVEGAFTRARARMRHLLGGVGTSLFERVRRLVATSSGSELAAGAVTAMLLAGPAWTGGVPVPGAAGGRPATPAHAAAGDPGAAAAKPAATLGGAGQDMGAPLLSAAVPPLHTEIQVGPPAFKKHNPPPGCWICLPIDAPFGLASTGVYVTGGPDLDPQDNVDAWQSCLSQLHPWDTSDPC